MTEQTRYPGERGVKRRRQKFVIFITVLESLGVDLTYTVGRLSIILLEYSHPILILFDST